MKNGGGCRDHRTLKSGVFQKWFNELSRLIEWCLCTVSDGMVFGLTSNLLCIFDIYFVLILSTWFTIKPIKKVLFSNFWKTWSNLHLCRRGPIKSVLFICPSVCLSVWLWHSFLRIYSVDVLNFLQEDILLYILKSDKVRFWKCICFLDNWVNKTNLEKKRNI